MMNNPDNGFLCIGDLICLYCEDTGGYLYSDQTNLLGNSLFVFCGQDRDKAKKIPNAHAVTFEVSPPNRYKLAKSYRQLKEKYDPNSEDRGAKKELELAKAAAEAEEQDNRTEHERLRGKRLRYGEVVQLRHSFTNKYIHVSTVDMSSMEQDKLSVFLEDHESKNAQFRILPTCKVKVEGEFVEILDQIVLESFKSSGTCLTISESFKGTYGSISELNVGVKRTAFSVLKYKHNRNRENALFGGSVVRFYHKDLEAYLTCEGVFTESPTEDVHFRIRETDPMEARTLYPSKSGITYWQVEDAKSIIIGQTIMWNQPVRLRHMTTRLYLRNCPEKGISMTDDTTDPLTEFRLVSLTMKPVLEEVDVLLNVRIEHIATGTWLHGSRDSIYERKQVTVEKDKRTKETVTRRWDGAKLLKVMCSESRLYPDAFSFQVVEEVDWRKFNYAAGMVPMLQSLIKERKEGKSISTHRALTVCQGLKELNVFMLLKGEAVKANQKLLRNLRVTDMLVEYLMIPRVHTDGEYKSRCAQINRSVYEALRAFSHGDSRKNALYLAKHIKFLRKQLGEMEGVGIQCSLTMIDLIKDNRDIVDCMREKDINLVIKLLSQIKHHTFLDLLAAMCVCNGVAMTENQNYITKALFKNKDIFYHIEPGAMTGDNNLSPNLMYVSKDARDKWKPLHKFVFKTTGSAEGKLFLASQLNLAKNLVYGHNIETMPLLRRLRKMFNWKVAFACLNTDVIPDFFRAKFADFLTDFFVDPAQTQHSVINEYPETFMLHEIKKYKAGKQELPETATLRLSIAEEFPGLKVFLQMFLQENSCMIASQPGRNLLMERILRLILRLVSKGYLGTPEDIHWLSVRSFRLANGKSDLPYPTDRTNAYTRKERSALVQLYRHKERFQQGSETKAIIAAKLQAIGILELMIMKEFKDRISILIEKFKSVQDKEIKTKRQSTLGLLMIENVEEALQRRRTATSVRKQLSKLLATVMKPSDVFHQIPEVMFDLTLYNNHDLILRSQQVLNIYFNSEVHLLEIASRCLILSSEEMMGMNSNVFTDVEQLRLLSKSTLNPERAENIKAILQRFTKDVTNVSTSSDHCYVAQRLQINHGGLDIILQILMQDMHGQYEGHNVQTEEIRQHCLRSLSVLAKDNTYAQSRLYAKLDSLLALKFTGKELALLLTQIFEKKTGYCIKILESQIEKIVHLAGETKIPEYVELMKAIIFVNGMTMKRNQLTCTKKIMQSYKTSAYVLGLTQEEREDILLDKKGENDRRYLVTLVDVLATCAEGSGQYAESMCQNLLEMDEIIHILNNRNINIKYKAPFARFLTFGYMASSKPPIQTGTIELPHKKELWKLFCLIIGMIQRVQIDVPIEENENNANITVVDEEELSEAEYEEDETFTNEIDPSDLTKFVLQGASPMILVFFTKYYKKDITLHPEESDILRRLGKYLLIFGIKTVNNATTVKELENIQECVKMLFTKSKGNFKKVEALHEQCNFAVDLLRMGKRVKVRDTDELKREREINNKLIRFTKNTKQFILSMSSERQARQETRVLKKLGKKKAEDDGHTRALPEGEVFKKHVQSYIRMGESKPNKRYKKTLKIIDALEISCKRFKKKASEEQENLDMKCLQLLRAVIQNLVNKLPDGWEDNLSKQKRRLKQIREVQDVFCDYGVVTKVVPLLARTNPEISMEVLCLLDTLLFNANRNVQSAVLKYFQSTCEEMFFQCVRHKLKMAIHAIKERRSVESQKTRQKEKAQAEEKKLESVKNDMEAQKKRGIFSNGIVDLSKLDKSFLKNSSTAAFRKLAASNRLIVNAASRLRRQPTREEEDLELEEDLEDMLEMKKISRLKDVDDSTDASAFLTGDESSVYIIFRVLSGLCDGQNKNLQNYLRFQPDNLKTYDLVSEVTQFVSVLYANITGNNIELLALVFGTLNEMSQGNQENRAVLINNKVVDFVNFILRRTSFHKDCTQEQILELRATIAIFLRSLVEENSPEALGIAREIAETLDVEAFRRVMTTCHRIQTGLEPNVLRAITGNDEQRVSKSIFSWRGTVDKVLLESVSVMGMYHYQVLARLHDVDRSLDKKGFTHPQQYKAFEFYKKGCMTIEVIKDDHLQRVHFRVKNKELIREEIKELVKWNIDRSSPSNKLRDLVSWSKEILKDIDYQKKILSNPIAMQLAKRWSIWNYLCIFMSFVINVLMLVCWDAKSSFVDIPPNATEIPKEVLDINPHIWCESYDSLQKILGYIHNACAVMLVFCYFLLKHPKLPDVQGTIYEWKKDWERRKKKKAAKKSNTLMGPEDDSDDDSDDEDEEAAASALQYKVFSLDTLYYLGLTASSFAGTFYMDYFFAFHLLNIVANNQLLKNVVKAVTQNGPSLIWVAIMGVIIIYIYALIAFAFFRPNMDPNDEMFCKTLAQCTVTLLRYGAAAELTDKLQLHPLAHGFTQFSYMTIYQLTFFILFTTIGLNVIFGIIVDTFSELRDLKWMAEKDMRANCFICSRDSYDFESAAQGMYHHVMNDHNMWAYMYYFIYLNEVKENDYTSVDLYVSKMLEADKMEFFPLNRAMCLVAIDKDDQDTRLDEATKLMKDIKQKQETIIALKIKEQKERKGPKIKLDIPLTDIGTPRTSRSSSIGSDDDFQPPPGGVPRINTGPIHLTIPTLMFRPGSTSSTKPRASRQPEEPPVPELPVFQLSPPSPSDKQAGSPDSKSKKPPSGNIEHSLSPTDEITGFQARDGPVTGSQDFGETPGQLDELRPRGSLDMGSSEREVGDAESYDTSLPPSASQTGRRDSDS